MMDCGMDEWHSEEPESKLKPHVDLDRKSFIANYVMNTRRSGYDPDRELLEHASGLYDSLVELCEK